MAAAAAAAAAGDIHGDDTMTVTGGNDIAATIRHLFVDDLLTSV